MNWQWFFECVWDKFKIFLCVVGMLICDACCVVCIVFAIMGAINWSLMWLLLLLAVPVCLFLSAMFYELTEWI